MNKIILILLVIGIISGVAFYSLKIQKQPKQENIPQSISTFEECLQAKDSKVMQTYPRQCEASDGKTYIEQVVEPVSTEKWELFKTGLGFSFKCPPSWKCGEYTEIKDAAYVNVQHYVGINMQLNLINSENFQQSFLRNPNYKTPMALFKDLEAKKDTAIKVLPETIKQGKPGTDQQIPPRYYYFKFDNMSELETKSGKSLIFPGEGGNPDTNIIIPLNTTDVVFITLSPTNIYQDSIIKAIISSVTP